MKLKIFAGIMTTLLLASIALYGVPRVKAPSIKIGVIGPEAWIQGQGMKEGAEIAINEINAGGGILGNTVSMVFADYLRGQPEPTAATGKQAADELIAAGVDFVIGGFRTEAVQAAREVFMDNKKIFFIAGASTDELIDNGPAPSPYPPPNTDVRENYNRYRYIFRVTPINSTLLFKSIAAFLKVSMASRLMPLYTAFGSPLKIAVLSEALTWTNTMHFFLTWNDWWNNATVTLPSPPYPPGYTVAGMGMKAYGGVNVVYQAKPSATETNFASYLNNVQSNQARLLIHVFSGQAGRALITQWNDLGIKAVPFGIDVQGQEITAHWDLTGGKCQYEGFLVTAGQRTYLNSRMVAFYDKTVADYGHAPIYTSYGVYDGIIAMHEMIEAEGRWPLTSDEMVPLIEKTERDSLTGKFKYTGPHPMGSTVYDTYMANATHSYLDINPTMKGTLHDVFSNELTPEWKEGYTRALFAQWLAGRLEIVYPMYSTAPALLPFMKIFMLPRLFYPYPEDIVQQAPYFGIVDIYDALTVRGTFGTVPGDLAWQYAADVDDDKIITLWDALAVRAKYNWWVTRPLPFCSESGHWNSP